ncbi:MAG TPA: TonB family protein [Arenicellales bacterium]|nr:TonB family protein [Arenicellales bacterium]
MFMQRRFWLIGIAGAALAHVVLFAGLFWEPADSGARNPGVGGIQVSLGPVGGTPGEAVAENEVTDAAPAERPAEVTAQTEPYEAAEPEPEAVTARTVEQEAVAETDTPPVEVQPKASEPTRQAAEPVEADAPQTVATATQRTVPTEEVAEADVRPEHESQVREQPPAPPEDTVQAEETRQEPDPGPSTAVSGTRSGDAAGSGDTASAGGTTGASPDYLAQLRAWLERHKRYPRRARLRRLEGTAMLHFVIDREGRVLEYSIRESSGHEVLDRAVAAMIERAQPLPGMPSDMSHERLALLLPVQFFLM